jgi:hypothetical protein
MVIMNVIETVGNSDAWRYTGGRISSALQSSAYFGALILQVGKIVSKAGLFCIPWACGYLRDTPQQQKWYSTRGWDHDKEQLEEFETQFFECMQNVFCAPEPQYDSLATASSSIFKNVFLGSYHGNYVNLNAPHTNPNLHSLDPKKR